MDLLDWGSTGYQVGALGIVAWTVSFLVVIRWWTDLLGKILAFVFCATSIVLLLSAYRLLTNDHSDGFLLVRTIVYWVYGAGIWMGIFSFYWFQLFTPRIKARTTRRKEAKDEQESDRTPSGAVADGGSHDRASGHR